jgi:hypothetical protein
MIHHHHHHHHWPYRLTAAMVMFYTIIATVSAGRFYSSSSNTFEIPISSSAPSTITPISDAPVNDQQQQEEEVEEASPYLIVSLRCVLL